MLDVCKGSHSSHLKKKMSESKEGWRSGDFTRRDAPELLDDVTQDD